MTDNHIDVITGSELSFETRTFRNMELINGTQHHFNNDKQQKFIVKYNIVLMYMLYDIPLQVLEATTLMYAIWREELNHPCCEV
jgi:hypothetical protein